jgi:hypothetical protein
MRLACVTAKACQPLRALQGLLDPNSGRSLQFSNRFLGVISFAYRLAFAYGFFDCVPRQASFSALKSDTKTAFHLHMIASKT